MTPDVEDDDREIVVDEELLRRAFTRLGPEPDMKRTVTPTPPRSLFEHIMQAMAGYVRR